MDLGDLRLTVLLRLFGLVSKEKNGRSGAYRLVKPGELHPGVHLVNPVAFGFSSIFWWRKSARKWRSRPVFSFKYLVTLTCFLNSFFCLSLNKEQRISSAGRPSKPVVSLLSQPVYLPVPQRSSVLCFPSLIILSFLICVGCILPVWNKDIFFIIYFLPLSPIYVHPFLSCNL